MIAPVYDCTGLPSLSMKAQKLAPGDFAVQNVIAEGLLFLSQGPVITDPTKLPLVYAALGLQINYQVEAGVDPYIFASVGSHFAGDTKMFHRGQIAAPLAVHEQARKLLIPIVAKTVAKEYTTLRSVRRVRRAWFDDNPLGW